MTYLRDPKTGEIRDTREDDPAYDDGRGPAELAKAILGGDRGGSGDAQRTSLAPRPHKAGGDPAEDVRLTSMLKRTLDRPRWQLLSPPMEVQEAWSRVVLAVNEAQTVADKWQRYDAEERRGPQQAVKTAQQAILAGEPPPAVVDSFDRSREKAAVVAEYEARVQVAAATRGRYDAVVRKAMPSWRTEVALALADVRQRAANAFREFDTAWSTWRTHVRVLTELNMAVDPHWSAAGVTTYHDQKRRTASNGIDAIQTILGSADPVLTGDYVADPIGVDPPVWVRRQWLNGNNAGNLQTLAELEAREQYQVTEFTRGSDAAKAAAADAQRRAEGLQRIRDRQAERAARS